MAGSFVRGFSIPVATCFEESTAKFQAADSRCFSGRVAADGSEKRATAGRFGSARPAQLITVQLREPRVRRSHAEQVAPDAKEKRRRRGSPRKLFGVRKYGPESTRVICWRAKLRISCKQKARVSYLLGKASLISTRV